MKKGTKLKIVGDKTGHDIPIGSIVNATGKEDDVIYEGRVFSVCLEDIEVVQVFDEIIEEIDAFNTGAYLIKGQQGYISLNIVTSLHSSGIFQIRTGNNYTTMLYTFSTPEDILKWLKKQNKTKEPTLNVEGKDLTITEIKKMIEKIGKIETENNEPKTKGCL